MNKFILMFSLTLLLTGCNAKSEYVDVSDREIYSNIVGRSFDTLAPLVLHGITLAENYEKKIDMFSVTIMPGFGGREVISRKTLPIGSRFSIVKVWQCSTCIPSYVEYEIDLHSENLNMPVRLDDLSKRKNDLIFMDNKLFK